jgi:hypothetical protein
METAEGNSALEIVLQSLDDALAGKRPMSPHQNYADHRQDQNGSADDPKPSPAADVKPAALPWLALSSGVCVTLGHCAQKSVRRARQLALASSFLWDFARSLPVSGSNSRSHTAQASR